MHWGCEGPLSFKYCPSWPQYALMRATLMAEVTMRCHAA